MNNDMPNLHSSLDEYLLNDNTNHDTIKDETIAKAKFYQIQKKLLAIGIDQEFKMVK